MKLPIQPNAYSRQVEQQRSSLIEGEFASVKSTLGLISSGVGAPQFTPNGRALYLRLDGGAGTTLYVYEGASWVAK